MGIRYIYNTHSLRRSIWLMMLGQYDVDENIWITDSKTNECFFANDDDKVLLDVLVSYLDMFRAKYQTKVVIDMTFDHVADAIVQRKKGKTESFDLLKSWTHEQWLSWIGSEIIKIHNP